MTTQRRGFLTKAGATIAAGAGAILASPAIHAQTAPTVKWRLSSSFPKTLDTIYGGAEDLALKLAEITGGKFIIEVSPAGVLGKPLETFDSVQKGDVECTHTAPYYFHGKDPVISMGGAIPFGMNSRLKTAWYHDGNGKKLLDEYYSQKWNVLGIPAGNTGTQMGGWFKKEFKTLEDIKGLKMRISGFGGDVLKRLGGVPTQIAATEIFNSLEVGKIDGAEWIGPYDDERLGLQKIAPYYYYPGWWEGSLQIMLFVNLKAHTALSPEFKAALEAACAWAHVRMQAKYDARNGPALKRLIASGTKPRAMPQPILDAAFRAAQDYYSDLGKTNQWWAKIYPDYQGFQKSGTAWFRYAENTYDNYMSRQLVR